MQMFMSRFTYFTPSVAVSMMATSWSLMSQPSGRPVKKAFVPEMNGVQSPLLSSIQRPPAFFFTIRPTRGGGFVAGISGLMAGENSLAALGGGFWPACGPLGKSTALGAGRLFNAATLLATIVDALPDS